MNQENSGLGVREALGRLTDDEPALGFTPAGLVTSGRRRKRRRMAAGAGTSLAAAAIMAGAALAVPGITGGLAADNGHGRQQPGSGTAANVEQTPTPTVAPLDPAEEKACKQDQRNQAAFQAKATRLLPPAIGTLSDQANIAPDAAVCSMTSVAPGSLPQASNMRFARWSVTRSGTVGEITALRTLDKGQWQSLRANPCVDLTVRKPNCVLTTRGKVLIEVTKDADRTSVRAVWPNDTSVQVEASKATTASGRKAPPLDAVPLTERQLLALALNPALRQ